MHTFLRYWRAAISSSTEFLMSIFVTTTCAVGVEVFIRVSATSWVCLPVYLGLRRFNSRKMGTLAAPIANLPLPSALFYVHGQYTAAQWQGSTCGWRYYTGISKNRRDVHQYPCLKYTTMDRR